MDAEHEGLENVPANVASVIAAAGIVETGNEDMDDLLAWIHEGKCMTCHAQLGRDTIILVNSKGVCGAYCGGSCLQDMGVIGWIQEQHDDIIDKIRFRGGEGDTPE